MALPKRILITQPFFSRCFGQIFLGRTKKSPVSMKKHNYLSLLVSPLQPGQCLSHHSSLFETLASMGGSDRNCCPPYLGARPSLGLMSRTSPISTPASEKAFGSLTVLQLDHRDYGTKNFNMVAGRSLPAHRSASLLMITTSTRISSPKAGTSGLIVGLMREATYRRAWISGSSALAKEAGAV